MASEVIQLGVAEVNWNDLKITRTMRFYIRPHRPWEISNYCTELTGITHEQITKLGRPYNEVAATLVKEWGPKSKMIYSWGNDEDCLSRTAAALNIQNPWGRMFDLGLAFRSSFVMKSNISLENALAYLGLEFEGKPHDALVDAKNTARLHIEMVRRLRNTVTK